MPFKCDCSRRACHPSQVEKWLPHLVSSLFHLPLLLFPSNLFSNAPYISSLFISSPYSNPSSLMFQLLSPTPKQRSLYVYFLHPWQTLRIYPRTRYSTTLTKVTSTLVPSRSVPSALPPLPFFPILLNTLFASTSFLVPPSLVSSSLVPSSLVVPGE